MHPSATAAERSQDVHETQQNVAKSNRSCRLHSHPDDHISAVPISPEMQKESM